MTVTQVPIIAWERRYMTPRECAKLQSMEALKILSVASTSAYKALGNAINVHVMRLIAQALVGNGDNGNQLGVVPLLPRRPSVQNAVAA